MGRCTSRSRVEWIIMWRSTPSRKMPTLVALRRLELWKKHDATHKRGQSGTFVDKVVEMLCLLGMRCIKKEGRRRSTSCCICSTTLFVWDCLTVCIQLLVLSRFLPPPPLRLIWFLRLWPSYSSRLCSFLICRLVLYWSLCADLKFYSVCSAHLNRFGVIWATSPQISRFDQQI